MYMVKQTNKEKIVWKTNCRSDFTKQLPSHCCKDVSGSLVRLRSNNTDSSGFVCVLYPKSFESKYMLHFV